MSDIPFEAGAEHQGVDLTRYVPIDAIEAFLDEEKAAVFDMHQQNQRIQELLGDNPSPEDKERFDFALGKEFGRKTVINAMVAFINAQKIQDVSVITETE